MKARHLLGIRQLSRDDFWSLLTRADELREIAHRELKKVPALRGRSVINLFLEPSTRTRTSFELAAKRLSADAINISESGSSTKKGETLLDTLKTLEAMSPDIVVLRHREAGACEFIAQHLTSASLVNAGDGAHEHPTQALLDCLTLHSHFNGKLSGLTVAIVGDVRHSRVARSNIYAHQLLGNSVRLVGPTTLVPRELADPGCFRADDSVDPRPSLTVHNCLESGIRGADVVMCLRIQSERQESNFIPSIKEYARLYCLNEAVLRRVAPDAIVLHPGPLNRGIELASDVADGPRSMISNQVGNGIAVRMSVLLGLTMGREQ